MLLSDFIKKVSNEIESLSSVKSCEVINADAITYSELNLKTNSKSQVFLDFVGIQDFNQIRTNAQGLIVDLAFNIYVFAKRDKSHKAFSMIASDSVQEICEHLNNQKWGEANEVLNVPQDISFSPAGNTDINSNSYERWEIRFTQKVRLKG